MKSTMALLLLMAFSRSGLAAESHPNMICDSQVTVNGENSFKDLTVDANLLKNGIEQISGSVRGFDIMVSQSVADENKFYIEIDSPQKVKSVFYATLASGADFGATITKDNAEVKVHCSKLN